MTCSRLVQSFVVVALLSACSAGAGNALLGKWGAADYEHARGMLGFDFTDQGVVTMTNADMMGPHAAAVHYDASKPGILTLTSGVGAQTFFYRISGNTLTLSQHPDLSDPFTLQRGLAPPTPPPYRSRI